MEDLFDLLELINKVLKHRNVGHSYILRPIVSRKSGFGSLKDLRIDVYLIEKLTQQKLIEFKYKGTDEAKMFNQASVDLLNLFMKDDV